MKHPIYGALCASLLMAVNGIVLAVSVSGQDSWETSLHGRDLDGNTSTIEAYYDTVLKVTWLADVDYGGTGGMTRSTANTWVSGLDINGITGWRLPHNDPLNGVIYNYDSFYDGSSDAGYNVSALGTMYAGSTASELAHMFYNTLGNHAYYDTDGNYRPGGGLTNTGPFANLGSFFWSDDNALSYSTISWYFNFSDGEQRYVTNNNQIGVWAVHDGDVGAAVVPVPAAAWLFAIGLLGLICVGRKL